MDEVLFWLRTAPANEDWFRKFMEAERKREMHLCILYRDRADGTREFYPGGGGGWPTDVRFAKLCEAGAESTLLLMQTYRLTAAAIQVTGIKVEKPWFVVRYRNDYLELDLTLDEDGDWWPTDHADPEFFDSEEGARAKVKELFDEDAVKRGLSDGTIRIERAPQEG